MPVNTVRIQNPLPGDSVFNGNAYRVYLRLSAPFGETVVIVVGDSLANGIPMLSQFGNDPVLLFNVVGTSMRASAFCLETNAANFIDITEIYRTAGGIT